MMNSDLSLVMPEICSKKLCLKDLGEDLPEIEIEIEIEIEVEYRWW